MNLTNLSKNQKLLTVFLSALLVGGCSDSKIPKHIVNEGEMVVYMAKKSGLGKGKYEYWVTDNSDVGWALRSNQIFSVGDKITFIKSN